MRGRELFPAHPEEVISFARPLVFSLGSETQLRMLCMRRSESGDFEFTEPVSKPLRF